jgi:glyoxylase-like metal-dependent hydrolase (beta-lactamase superfamily II)
LEKISKNVYAETKFNGCNPGFVVTSDGVVMIDTPQVPTQAVKWREIIAKYGKVKYIINNEPHGDHVSGNYFFKGTVIAHEGTRQAILKMSPADAKERYKKTSPADYVLMKRFKYRPPTITFTKEMTLYVGDHTFQIMHLPGHTPYQLAVFIPEEKVIFTSDNVLYEIPVYLQHAEPFEWIESLKKLAELDAEVIVPGHGEICTPAYIPEMCARVQEWIDAVDILVKKGMTLAEVENNFTFRDRYLQQPGREAMAPFVQKANITRLYAVLKDGKGH